MSQDRIIIATALPRITDTFHSLSSLGWYASAYMLSSSATQLLFGRLYLVFSSKAVFLSALVLFEAGSVLCAAAPSSAAFIAGRAVAGAGAAGVFSGVVVLVVPLVSLAQRPAYMGVVGAMFGLASVASPLVGGAFTENDALTWRWCFWINLPLGGVALAIVCLLLPSPPPTARLRGRLGGWSDKLRVLDPLGSILLAGGMVALLLALQWGGTEYGWGSGRVAGLLVTAGVLLALWGYLQWRSGGEAGSESDRRGHHVTIPRRVLMQRSIISASFFSFCVGGIILVTSYYLPVWFQAVQGVDALQSGLRGLPYVLGVVVGSVGAGALVSRLVGFYTPFAIASAVGMAVGCGLLTRLRVDSGPAEWIGYQLLLGIAMGLGMQQPALAAQVVLHQDDVALGASLVLLMQGLGGAVFVCVGQNIFLLRLVRNLTGALVTNHDAGDPLDVAALVSSVGATQLRSAVSPHLLPTVLEAYNGAIDYTMYVAVALAAFSIVPALGLEWRNVRAGMLVDKTAKDDVPAEKSI